MSRRANPTRRQHGTHTRTVTYCRCGAPTRDQAFVCEDCLDRFAQDLRTLAPAGDEPGLWADLWSVIAGERGIDYRALGGSSGASWSTDDDDPKAAVETGLVLNERATRQAREIETLLRRLVRACRRLKVADSAPEGWQPRGGGVPAAAEWLAWRVTAMAYHPELAKFPERLGDAIDAAQETVMPLPDYQWLGACGLAGCEGNVFARRDEGLASCHLCEAPFDAQERRTWLVASLEDQLCTAAQIADLYDPDPATRIRVRKRINQWAHRDVLLGWPRVCDWTPGLCPWPAPDRGHNLPKTGLVFRFGDAFDLLIAHDAITDHGSQP